VLPCVDIFVVDRFFVWAPILRTRLALRLGAHLADAPFVALGQPTYGRADVPCVCVAEVRWGAQLADVPCVTLGAQLADRPCVAFGALCSHLADVPCVALGRPTLVGPY
jgi:hypothetical protein